MGIENVMNFVLEKQKELLLALENFGGQFIGWLDKGYPPETRGEQQYHWLKLLLTVVLIMCFGRCCCGGRRVKMMKAPGGNYRMPRNDFQSNPRS